MDHSANDLHVIPKSDALHGKRIDVIVSGSIAAIESVRFIRSLRRLGATVTPWLTQGGSSFITPMSLTWAAAHEAVTGFSGTASHIALSDAVVVAPASSSILAKIARGMTDSHCTALVASALGQRIPVLILPTMHDSLREAPAMKEHLSSIAGWPHVTMLRSREEEGKQKFPDPAVLADQVSHIINAGLPASRDTVLITMGTTRGYIDDVRYISNYSSGHLGTLIAEEIFRRGYQTQVVAGPAEFYPKAFGSLIKVLTTSEMLDACQVAASRALSGAVFCASVLDYEPSMKSMGKIRSGASGLTVSLVPTPKIIGQINLLGKPKIGFKLEIGLSESRAIEIAKDYIARYNLTSLIANDLSTVSTARHKALAIDENANVVRLDGKEKIARHIATLISTDQQSHTSIT